MGFDRDKINESPTDVTNDNLEGYNLDDIIAALQKEDSDLTQQEATEIAGKLNTTQISGVINFGLSIEEVKQPSFGEHTLKFILQNLDLDVHEAFKLSNLDEDQIRGVLYYGLKREQVTTPNFGWYTLLAISFF